MAIKDWLKNVSSEVSKATSKGTGRDVRRAAKRRHSVSDLIALGRVEEAEQRLRDRLKRNNRDHHARLKLADLLFKTDRRIDAVEEYMFVAEGYASDGFDDKAHALLIKLERLMPGEPKLTAKIERLEHAKEMERRCNLARKALLEDLHGAHAFTVQQLAEKLDRCSLLEGLTEEQIQRLFRRLELVRMEEGEELVRRGGQREELLILLRGEIAAEVLLANGSRTAIRTFDSGKVIGDKALLERQPWAADYSVTRKAAALKLDRSGLEELLLGESDPRGLLDALRSQNSDGEVVEAVAGLSAPAEVPS